MTTDSKCTDHTVLSRTDSGVQMVEYLALNHPLTGPYREQLKQLGDSCIRYREKGMQEEYDDSFAMLNMLDSSMRKQFGVTVKRPVIQPVRRT
jgi:hypothetical protein